MNLTARGDTTALQPRLKPLYHEMLDLKLVDAIEDFVDFDNYFRGSLGLNAHEAYGYLAQPVARRSHRRLARALDRARRLTDRFRAVAISGPDGSVRASPSGPDVFASHGPQDACRACLRSFASLN